MSNTGKCLNQYSVIESGQPNLNGHILEQFSVNKSVWKITDWTSLENAKNSFHPVKLSKVENFIAYIAVDMSDTVLKTFLHTYTVSEDTPGTSTDTPTPGISTDIPTA